MTEAARARSELTTELNHSTGAVVVKEGKVIGRAANQAGFKNRKLQEFHGKGFCVRRLLKISSGQKYWLCPGCAKSHDHAEWRAVRGALQNAQSLTGTSSIAGADLYLHGHWWCCKPCWDAMIAAGIRDVYLVEGAEEQFKR